MLPHYEELKNEFPDQCKSPEECIELYNKFQNAIVKHKTQIIYYVAMQGRLLEMLKEYYKNENKIKEFNVFLRQTLQIQSGTANIYIKIHKLLSRFNKLMYSTLSFNYFNYHHKTIVEICEESPEEFT